jgi:formate dehydrogenase maturation protein FdhE|tara:strand:+ start:3594 stop:3926 length:333 start_codon:yes stop_codon:yes gene_type:complete
MVQKSKKNIVYDTVDFNLASGKDIFNKLAFKGTKRWRKEAPELCPYCCGDEIQGVEILGAKDGPLFWECSMCAERMLRYTQTTTIKYLEKTVDLYVDLEGLANIWEQLPN